MHMQGVCTTCLLSSVNVAAFDLVWLGPLGAGRGGNAHIGQVPAGEMCFLEGKQAPNRVQEGREGQAHM